MKLFTLINCVNLLKYGPELVILVMPVVFPEFCTYLKWKNIATRNKGKNRVSFS